MSDEYLYSSFSVWRYVAAEWCSVVRFLGHHMNAPLQRIYIPLQRIYVELSRMFIGMNGHTTLRCFPIMTSFHWKELKAMTLRKEGQKSTKGINSAKAVWIIGCKHQELTVLKFQLPLCLWLTTCEHTVPGGGQVNVWVSELGSVPRLGSSQSFCFNKQQITWAGCHDYWSPWWIFNSHFWHAHKHASEVLNIELCILPKSWFILSY